MVAETGLISRCPSPMQSPYLQQLLQRLQLFSLLSDKENLLLRLNQDEGSPLAMIFKMQSRA